MKSGLLQCEISEGQFTDEYAVDGEMYDGSPFSLFAWKSDLECVSFPRGDERARARIRVEILDEQGDLLLVRLPKRTLENGDIFTVRRDQVDDIKHRRPQEA